jgi:DNA-binding transcriptional regulator LsrR (DeoR family)
MTLADLQRVPKVIGVAGGAGKVEAIASALLGRHLDVLITDSLTAEKLLERQASVNALSEPQTV